jgi:hypothetical protein
LGLIGALIISFSVLSRTKTNINLMADDFKTLVCLMYLFTSEAYLSTRSQVFNMQCHLFYVECLCTPTNIHKISLINLDFAFENAFFSSNQLSKMKFVLICIKSVRISCLICIGSFPISLIFPGYLGGILALMTVSENQNNLAIETVRLQTYSPVVHRIELIHAAHAQCAPP